MTVIHLLRHGQASFGAVDYDVLSPVGHQQAKVLGEELRARGIEPVQAWSGTLARQQDTAATTLAAAGFDLECGTDARWNEYDHLGLVQSHLARENIDLPASPREFQGLLDQALGAWVGGSRVGESTFSDFADGAVAALTEVAAGGDALVFTSGGVIAALCSRLMGADVVAINRVVVNAAITKIIVGRSGASLVSFNEHGHFDGTRRDLLTYR
ncbi:histidine phosphatase family protein [Actinokineospora sp. HUAS TT18]|uniref:histidine phosphatase family protein n=1 Tax=Actinokineospora sp. HUAS TT18 TaxID=3447451 RepID=UPI003F5264BE